MINFSWHSLKSKQKSKERRRQMRDGRNIIVRNSFVVTESKSRKQFIFPSSALVKRALGSGAAMEIRKLKKEDN